MDMSLWQPRDWLSGLRALDRHDWISPLLLGVGRMPSVPDWVAPRLAMMASIVMSIDDPFMRTKFVYQWRLVGRALAQGPKVYCPSAETCEAMRHVDIRISWKEFALPFDPIIIKFPPDWARGFGENEPVAFLGGFVMPGNFYGTTKLARSRMEVDWIVDTTRYASVEASLHNEVRDSIVTPEDKIIERVAMNSALLLTMSGTKRLGWLHPKERQRHKRLKRERRHDADGFHFADMEVIGEAKPIKVVDCVVDRPEANSHGGDPETHVKPHWRRGHFRRQPYGTRSAPHYETILIRPTFIRGRYNGDQETSPRSYAD